MTKKTAQHLDLVLLILFLISFPANYYMMKKGIGIYNNDWNNHWRVGQSEQYTGPSQCGRTFSLLLSPIMAPISGIAAISESTMPDRPIPDDDIQISGGRR